MFKKYAKKAGMILTTPVFNSYFTIITNTNKSFIKDKEQLYGKKLYVTKELCYNILHNIFPSLNLTLEKDLNKIKAGLDKDYYGLITINEEADYIIDRFGYGKYKISGFLLKENPLKFYMAVRGDLPVLASIIQKSLNDMTSNKLEEIKNSWHLSRYHEKINYTLLFNIVFIFLVILTVIFVYQAKLKNFNKELEKKVDEKTKELKELNESLEAKVYEKVQELTKKDKLLARQSRQAIMGEMIQMIAHQWRQPLNTITLQLSDLKLKKMLGEEVSDEELEKIIDKINDTILYLSDTINDFQNFFDPNKKIREISLCQVFDKTLNFIQPRLKSNKIDIRIIEKDIIVNVYENELIQVMLNILNNAIDAFEECDNKNRYIVLEADVDDENVHIYITDNACGIKDDIIEHIFEPYFSTKGKNGTGLGLYMSQMIMQKQFNGDIKVESSKEGTTFIITFPKV